MKILPPVWVLLCISLMVFIHFLAPVAALDLGYFSFVGALLAAAGVFLVFQSIYLFRRAQTPLRPFEESTALVLEGPYRYSRNPIYLGFVLVLFGTAIALGSVGPFVVPPLFWCIMHFEYALKEEAFLEERFGQRYLEFKQATKRWL